MFGEFIQVRTVTFEGLFELKNVETQNILTINKNSVKVNNDELILTQEGTIINHDIIMLMANHLATELSLNINNNINCVFYYDSNNLLHLLYNNNTSYFSFINIIGDLSAVNPSIECYVANTSTSSANTLKDFYYDEENETFSAITNVSGSRIVTGDNHYYVSVGSICTSSIHVNINEDTIKDKSSTVYNRLSLSSSALYTGDTSDWIIVEKIKKYLPIDTQLSNVTESDLNVGVTAYGDNGVVTGDGSLYENLDQGQVFNKIFSLDKISEADIYGDIYGDINNSISSITDSKKITYLKKDNNGTVLFGKTEKQIQVPYLDTIGRDIYTTSGTTNYIARYKDGNNKYWFSVFDSNHNMLLQNSDIVDACECNDKIYCLRANNQGFGYISLINLETQVITDLYSIRMFQNGYDYINCLSGGCLLIHSHSSNDYASCYVYNTNTNSTSTVFEYPSPSYTVYYTILNCGDEIYFRYRDNTNSAAMKKYTISTGMLSTVYSGQSTSYSGVYKSHYYGYLAGMMIGTDIYTTGSGSNKYKISTTSSTVTQITLSVNSGASGNYCFRRTLDGELYIAKSDDSSDVKIGLISNSSISGTTLSITTNFIDSVNYLPVLSSDTTQYWLYPSNHKYYYSFGDNEPDYIVSWNNNKIKLKLHTHIYLYAECSTYSISDESDYDIVCINTLINTSDYYSSKKANNTFFIKDNIASESSSINIHNTGMKCGNSIDSDLQKFDLSGITEQDIAENGIFQECYNLEEFTSNEWNHITNILHPSSTPNSRRYNFVRGLFKNCTSLNDSKIGNLSITFASTIIGEENKYDLSYMLYNCQSLQYLPTFFNLTGSSIMNVSYMFYNCFSLDWNDSLGTIYSCLNSFSTFNSDSLQDWRNFVGGIDDMNYQHNTQIMEIILGLFQGIESNRYYGSPSKCTLKYLGVPQTIVSDFTTCSRWNNQLVPHGWTTGY